MHKIKKATASVAKGTENAEFADYKNRLENLGSYLRESSAALNASERAWKEVCYQQKMFSEKFANRYPDKDKVREFGKQSAELSQSLVKEFVLKTDGSSAAHWAVDAVVQEYLTEIEEISNEYRPIADAMKEVSMYTKKVDDLQNAKKPDDSKISRNMEKLEEAKKKYDKILDRIVDKQKRVYSKRQVALKATYVAYWSSQLRAFNLLDESLDPTREFVQGAVESISDIRISSMTPQDIEAFLEANGNVPDVPKGGRGSAASTPTSTGRTPGASPIASPIASPVASPAASPVAGEKGLPVSPVGDSEVTPVDPPAAAI